MLLLVDSRFSGLWVLVWCCLVLVKGYKTCQRLHVGRSNIISELESDVLLPCNFSPVLLGVNMTADIAAVWSQSEPTVNNIVELKLPGEATFWSNRGGRVQTFPKLAESGNFSILLRKVNRTDLGSYRCELHRGINCSIAYQEVQLGLATGLESQKSIIAGTSGGLAFLLLACVFYIVCKRGHQMKQEAVCENPIYDSVSHTMQDRPRRDEGSCENPIYVTTEDLEDPEKHRESNMRPLLLSRGVLTPPLMPSTQKDISLKSYK